MKTRIQQGFTLIELLVVITIIAILASLAVPTFSKIQERGNMTKGINNCRQVITALRLYSGDNNGNYPDTGMDQSNGGGGGGGGGNSSTSNVVFRELFKAGSIDNEMVFGCPASKDGNPDGNIGKSDPNFTEAVKSGENHWAFTSGLTDSASGSFPLVYENPVGGQWPSPTWNCDAAGTGAVGRSWSGGKVIVGMNDSSVTTQQCTSPKGASNELGGQKNKTSSDTNVFKQNDTGSGGSTFKVLLAEGGSGGGA